MKDHSFENRKYIIGAITLVIVLVYIVRLFTLQILSDDYRKSADSNAFLKKIEYPARGAMYDRNASSSSITSPPTTSWSS